ncbi:hypothetical protein [Variovorax saccharolyticus]|uniref:hypothetical protein n=1 Tax=Variovorax saccharolyticus TaxID=3053516 RepID=UPI002577F4E8|nr:hypothetical protein [Variovorax sp. J31P216]MDM0024631.1 hypothetical protein [Variovorax sp. J31P216]
MAIEQAHQIPSDFPRSLELGAVAGYQSKLAVKMVEGRFVEGLTDEEHKERFLACQDLVEQLESYCRRKLRENAALDVPTLLPLVRRGVVNKDWDLSVSELDWIMNRLSDRLNRMAAPGPAHR